MSLDNIQYYICEQQQELFEFVQQQNADVEAFAHDFLNSRFCNASLDKPYSVDQFADIVNWLEFLEQEGCVIQPDASEKRESVPCAIAGWIGFTYRQLQIVSGWQSRDLFAAVPFKRLLLGYDGLHTVDTDMAAEIIMEDFHITGLKTP